MFVSVALDLHVIYSLSNLHFAKSSVRTEVLVIERSDFFWASDGNVVIIDTAYKIPCARDLFRGRKIINRKWSETG